MTKSLTHPSFVTSTEAHSLTADDRQTRSRFHSMKDAAAVATAVVVAAAEGAAVAFEDDLEFAWHFGAQRANSNYFAVVDFDCAVNRI